MAIKRTDNEVRITPSVFDRLLDFEPQLTSEAPKSRAKSLRELKQSVRRDIEWLLNTRRTPMEVDANLLAEKLKNAKRKNLNIYFDYLPQEDHATIAHQAISNAFQFLNPKAAK